MDHLTDRIKYKKLVGRLTQADEAVSIIKSGMSVGISSDLLPICDALERRADEIADFNIQLWSGVAVLRADHTLGKKGIIKRRIGQQSLLRKAINANRVEYLDTPLGFFYQSIRSGNFNPLDVAIVDAVGFTEDGYIIPSHGVADMPNFAIEATQVIVQLNTYYPLELEGIHDIYLPQNPPHKQPIMISSVDDRIGKTFIPLKPEKIKHIVPYEASTAVEMDLSVNETSKSIGKNLIKLFRQEVSMGRLPRSLLPIQIGLGAIPSAVLDELSRSEFENLEFYSAILNDRVLDLIDQRKVRYASGSGFFFSPHGEKRFINELNFYKRHIILRPVEITDCPEVVMRLGILALNGAIEVDIYGHVNSSHIMGGDVVSGVGGAGEFANNAYLSVVLLPSIAKNGNISSIVPMVSHVDITEHGVDIVVTEQGVADLRGLIPRERAERIIECCAHPEYRPLLLEYLQKARTGGGGHQPQLLKEAFSFHLRFLQTGSMKVNSTEE